MDYLGLTSTEQIRAVLTVSEADLPDRVIDGFGLDDDLGALLDKALPTWEAMLAAGGKNARLLRLIGKYYCAGTLAGTAQVFVLKKQTDGSNEGQRSDKDGWLWMSVLFLGKADDALDEILDDLGLTPEVVLPNRVFTRVIPDRDPVTTPRPTTNVS